MSSADSSVPLVQAALLASTGGIILIVIWHKTGKWPATFPTVYAHVTDCSRVFILALPCLGATLSILSMGLLLLNFPADKISGTEDYELLKKSGLQRDVDCSRLADERVWLISYAEGFKRRHQSSGLRASAHHKCVDYYRCFDRVDIARQYLFQHRRIFSCKRGAGYWLWKPYFIDRVLARIATNDILIFADSDFRLARSPAALIGNLSGSTDIALFENAHTNERYVKPALMRLMKINSSRSAQIQQAVQLQAGFWVIRNTRRSRRFVATWLSWCQRLEAIGDWPASPGISHRHDQAILTLLYMQHPRGIKTMPYHWRDLHFLH